LQATVQFFDLLVEGQKKIRELWKNQVCEKWQSSTKPVCTKLAGENFLGFCLTCSIGKYRVYSVRRINFEMINCQDQLYLLEVFDFYA
jgi:hypothetical protein